LVGVLRSSIGALSDRHIEALSRFRLLDARLAVVPGAPDPEAEAAYTSAVPVYVMLRELARRLPHLPLTDVMDTVLAGSPVLELAAASIDGEQAVANVLKLRDLAVALARRPDLTLSDLVAELTKRLVDLPDETESSLAEDLDGQGQPGFVRLLSIHKAKGLEFPVVILAGLQRGTNRNASRVMIQHDWSTDIVGIRVGDMQTLEGVYVGDKLAARQRAEQSRVLYVAMTRAKRRLILSAGLTKQVAADSFLSMVADGLGLEIDALGRAADVPIAGGAVRVRVLPGKAVPLRLSGREAFRWQDAEEDASAVDAQWKERTRRCEAIHQRPAFLTPSLLKAQAEEREFDRRRGTAGSASDTARVIGVLAHRVLEEWNFADDPRKLNESIELACSQIDLNDSGEIENKLKEIFEIFAASESYGVLRSAHILGKEVPFSIPWYEDAQSQSGAGAGITAHVAGSNSRAAAQLDLFIDQPGSPARPGGGSGRPEVRSPGTVHGVMEGVVDLIYRLHGQVWVADYKTDRLEEADVAARLEEYRFQAHVYKEAVLRCLGLNHVRVQFLFLRTGKAVEMCGEGL
jgi:ATP-dependent helicase/nuclease subunit A